MFDNLQLVRLGFRLDATRPKQGFLGAKLRGGIGGKLKQLACPTGPDSRCEDCLVSSRCVFAYLYVSPPDPEMPVEYVQSEYPHPYVLAPAQDDRGPEVRFALTLIGRGIDYLPFFVLAARRLSFVAGTGPGRLLGVDDLARADHPQVYDGSAQRFLDRPGTMSWADFISADDEAVKEIRLEFVTPTKIKSDQRLADRYEFPVLAGALLRRIGMLTARHCGRMNGPDFKTLLSRAADVETVDHRLILDDRFRGYSLRQQQAHRFTGLVGTVTYRGALGEFLPLFRAGELLHVGSKATFGLGRYVIRSVS